MFTRTLIPLMQREWLQHRFGWMLLATIPFALALLPVLLGDIQFDFDVTAQPDKLALLLSVVPVMASTAVMLMVALVTAFITVSGLARRDHGDRSIEYWLSLPVSHTAALGVPMLVHLVLMPAAALLVGWLGGQVLGVALVGRVAGLSALPEVPWAGAFVATVTLLARFLAGLPLAVAWALPIILLLMLLNAWFKRWGWVVLIVGLGLLSLVDQLTVGQRWLLTAAGELLRHAGLSLMGAGGLRMTLRKGADGVDALLGLPALAANDFVAALGALASPLFIGGLLFSAACFALLLRWRQNGAGQAD